jgi:glycogen synthase
MALGRIVVASNVGGHRELIEDGKNGFLFPAGDPDSLSDCLRNVLSRRGEQWNSVRAYARRFVEEQRSWKRSVAGYAPLYERLASRPPASDLARMGA